MSKKHPDKFAGRFPGACELSVISEGSYRTSQDGESSVPTLPRSRPGTFDDDSESGRLSAALHVYDDGSMDGLSLTDGENAGIFRTFPDPSDGKSARPQRLTAAAIATNTRILGMDNSEDEDEEVVAGATVTNPSTNEDSPVAMTEQMGSGGKRRNVSSSVKKPGKPTPSFFHVVPMWLKLAVMLCFLLVVGSISIGLAAALKDGAGTGGSPDAASADEDEEFLRHHSAQQANEVPPTLAPSLRPSSLSLFPSPAPSA